MFEDKKETVEKVKTASEEETVSESTELEFHETEHEEDLKSRFAGLEKEKEEAKEKYLRTLAEFENYRRRTTQERINWIKNANETLVLKLCDVLDDFERAFSNKESEIAAESIYQGMEAIFRKMQSILKSEGVSKIETEDREFDPMYHDAIVYTPSDMKKDRIVAVIQNGYIMNNKVIRPVKVALSSGKTEENNHEE